jgi:hypothetical protein
MTEGLYHRLLRISLVVVALVLIFDGGFITPISKTLSENTYAYLASGAVGVFVGVEQNEINSLTAQIAERTEELDAREQVLKEREIAARDFGSAGTDYSVYVLSLILFVLTLLILVNYVLDWRRSRMVYA